MTFKDTKGFTLVEVAIVLIIIGMIIGGVLTGRELIQVSAINNIMSDIEKIKTATINFRTKYQYLPGDMPDATSQWGIQAGATGNDDTCYTSLSSSQTTCNGNGNGQISGGYTNTGNHERGRFWQHLSNAGFITGQFTGFHGLFAAETRIGGTNAMRGAISATHYNIEMLTAVGLADPNYFEMEGQHAITNTGDFTLPATTPNRAILTPLEYQNIDAKIDDGKPATGIVRAPKLASTLAPNCSTTADPATAVYAMSQNNECFLIMLLGF